MYFNHMLVRNLFTFKRSMTDVLKNPWNFAVVPLYWMSAAQFPNPFP